MRNVVQLTDAAETQTEVTWDTKTLWGQRGRRATPRHAWGWETGDEHYNARSSSFHAWVSRRKAKDGWYWFGLEDFRAWDGGRVEEHRVGPYLTDQEAALAAYRWVRSKAYPGSIERI
jgi:hypothetical protein